MKHLKSFENNKIDPEVGDYVYCHITKDNQYNPNEFIGKITNIITRPGRWPYRVEYPLNHNDPEILDRLISRDEIVDFAKTPEELEKYITAKKYNL